ncbi:R-spondin-3-like [Periophthalmus magnuspinnatus]|uniref:R-spondin-3-like n=1 Tax=Periophthalmus magnuspinnatus TaxID=409849 RepID=UPI002436FD9C|nr:R-spondin-3-like [Periophthalmus magnuspinnatus]
MLISSLIWILHLMNLTIGQDKIMRHKRSSTTSSSTAGRLCPTGCVTCSALNGCLSCKSRLFFHLEVDGMRQRGVCLSSCPRGHYGTRSPYINTCTRCKEDCASCFSESFCTRCHSDRFLFRGKCERSCPFGLTANLELRECIECPAGCELCMRRNMCARCRTDLYTLQGQCYLTCPKGFEPDEQLMQCLPQVHCEVGEWSDWSPCVHKRSMKMYRRGEKTRTRQMLSPPSRFRKPCPKLFQFRKCIFKKRQSFISNVMP